MRSSATRNAEAGIRASAAHSAEALALDDDERAALERDPATLDEVIDGLLATADATGPATGKR